MPHGTIDEVPIGVAVEPVREIRVEIRLPTPPALEIAFYGTALLLGIAVGAVASVIAHVPA